jgi:hypothetical protein
VTVQFWVGVGFAAAVVVFLFIAFYAAKNMTPGQWVILRFLTALCAACSAAFIMGEVSVNVVGDLSSGGKWTIQATSGFGAFVLIWLTFPKPPEIVLPDGVNISIAAEMSFKDAAQLCAIQDKASAVFEGFKDHELSTPLIGGGLQAKTMHQIIEALGARGRTAIPKYKVSFANAIYTLDARS